ILSGLMLLDLMVKSDKSITELMDTLTEKVGPHFYDRWDLKFEESQRQAIISRLEAAKPDVIAAKSVERIDTRDGFRYVLAGGYWALVRFSGTEPLLRIYAEAESPGDVSALLAAVRDLAGV
ncbi:MAG: phosphoglucomutase/phosphomannomutase family protein, partial [Chloroflexi bacterium]|nr:phosphoglucomutase/phosphomannomutase family protein [Chloroflexota bacterium]